MCDSGIDNCPGHGMFRVGLHSSRPGQHFLGVAVDSGHVAHNMTAPGQGARLVEEHDVDRAHALQGQPILDQDPVAGGQPGGDRDDQRDGEPESVGAGDHEDRDRAGDRVLGLPEGPPDCGSGRSSPNRHIEEHSRCPVGQNLGPGAGLLCLGHEPLDPGEGGVLPDRLHLDADRRVGGNGSGDHVVADALGHWLRLTGHHRLVHLRVARGDDPVGRDPGPGPDQNEVTDGERGDRDGFGHIVDDPLRLVGQELCQGGEGTTGLTDRSHLHPVAEEHDRDQGSQLPPEVEIEPAERGRQRCQKATVIAMAMSNIIPGCRSRTSWTAPRRKGDPP